MLHSKVEKSSVHTLEGYKDAKAPVYLNTGLGGDFETDVFRMMPPSFVAHRDDRYTYSLTRLGQAMHENTHSLLVEHVGYMGSETIDEFALHKSIE